MQEKASFERLCEQAAAILEARQGASCVFVALDGRCGSGKTTLAARLAAQFPASVTLHTDDYYLPLERRAPGWQHTPCANMDLARLRAEALEPLRAGYVGQSRAYCCGAGAYRAAGALLPQPLVIVEGSYALHPMLAGFYDLRVFVTCSAAQQAQRLQAREGERYAAFANRWIPLEEAYFAQYRIEQNAQLVIDTTDTGENG